MVRKLDRFAVILGLLCVSCQTHMVTDPGPGPWSVETALGEVGQFLSAENLRGGRFVQGGVHPRVRGRGSSNSGLPTFSIKVFRMFYHAKLDAENRTLAITRYKRGILQKFAVGPEPSAGGEEEKPPPGSDASRLVADGKTLYCAYHVTKHPAPSSILGTVLAAAFDPAKNLSVEYPLTLWVRYHKEESWILPLAEITGVEIVKPDITWSGNSNVYDITMKKGETGLCELRADIPETWSPWKRDEWMAELFYESKRFAHAVMFLSQHFKSSKRPQP